MIVRQAELGFIFLGKMDDVCKILSKAIEAGYGNLPAVLSIKLYLERN